MPVPFAVRRHAPALVIRGAYGRFAGNQMELWAVGCFMTTPPASSGPCAPAVADRARQGASEVCDQVRPAGWLLMVHVFSAVRTRRITPLACCRQTWIPGRLRSGPPPRRKPRNHERRPGSPSSRTGAPFIAIRNFVALPNPYFARKASCPRRSNSAIPGAPPPAKCPSPPCPQDTAACERAPPVVGGCWLLGARGRRPARAVGSVGMPTPLTMAPPRPGGGAKDALVGAFDEETIPPSRPHGETSAQQRLLSPTAAPAEATS